MIKYTIPLIIFFVVLCVNTNAQETKPKTSNPAVIEHPWVDKTVAYLGDSVTDPRNRESKNKYWSYLEQWLNINTYVYGRNGAQWKELLGQAAKLQAEHGNDFDAIMIFVGTNDYNSAVPIGEWFTEEKAKVNVDGTIIERTRRITVYDENTYRGCINIVLDSLKRTWPDKQIVMLTPIHRSYASFGQWNVQPTEDFQNGCGEYLDTYVNSIKEAAAIWSVPVIDIYALTGLFPMHKEQVGYFYSDIDRLHPNDKGQKRLAQCLYYQLLALPCSIETLNH